MRKELKILTIFALVILISMSCKKIKSLADVEFETTFTADLDCVVPPAGAREINANTFNASAVINPASDPDVAKYIKTIQSYQILSISGTITSISKNVTLVSANMNVFNNSNNASWQFSNVPLSVGTVLTLGNENGQWNTVSQILMTGQTFTVSINGETDQDDVTFTVEVAIKTNVTANPL